MRGCSAGAQEPSVLQLQCVAKHLATFVSGAAAPATLSKYSSVTGDKQLTRYHRKTDFVCDKNLAADDVIICWRYIIRRVLSVVF